MSQKDTPDTGRRGFLRKLGLAGTAVAAASVASTSQAAVVQDEPEKKADSGYQKTEHVRTYYETLRN